MSILCVVFTVDPDSASHEAPDPLREGGVPWIDARESFLQVGSRNVQNFYLDTRTWSGGPARPLLEGSPYRGLSAFEEGDAEWFFGRDEAVGQVLNRLSRILDNPAPLVVSGPSGAGKSSLLRAGVLPRLRRGGLDGAAAAASWPCLLFTPGKLPLDELALQVTSLAGMNASGVRRTLVGEPAEFALIARQAVLAQRDDSAEAGTGRLLLIIDQFEQIFSMCSDEMQRRAFITALHAAATRPQGAGQVPSALVVLGVRADFEMRCAAGYQELETAVQDRYLLPAMTSRQLRLAITGPAVRGGSDVEPALTEALLEEINARKPATGPGPAAGPGILPLLSHALDQAWRTRAGDMLTLADYERTGGIETAVARSAQQTYDALSPAQQAIARRVFIALTAASSEGTDSAIPVGTAEIGELADGVKDARDGDVTAALEAFAARRLLTLSAGTVEITHEVILTAWPLLRDSWLAENHGDLIARTGLRAATAEWERHNSDPAYLYTGSLLEGATAIEGRSQADRVRYPRLAQAQQSFLSASRRAQQRRVRVRHAVRAVIATLAVALMAITVLALVQRNTAISERNTAASNTLVDQSEMTGSSDPALARLEALAAWRLDPTARAHDAMLTAAVLPLAAVLGGPAQQYAVAFSPHGSLMATNGGTGTQLWNVKTRKVVVTLPAGNQNTIYSVAFSPNGSLLAAGGVGKTQIWDVSTHRLVATLPGDSIDSVTSVAFSPDGSLVATNGGYAGTRLWKVATHRLVTTLRSANGDFIKSVAFSPGGSLLATSTNYGVQLWDVATHKLAATLPCSVSPESQSLAFSPDGSFLVVPAGGETQLWNVKSHRLAARLSAGNGNSVSAVAYSANGSFVAAVTDNGTQLWNVAESSSLVATFPAGNSNSNDAPTAVAFSPDGAFMATTTGSIWLANLNSSTGTGSVASAAFATLQAGTDVSTVVFSSDGSLLAAGTEHGIQLWNVKEPKVDATFPIRGNPYGALSVLFSPDGSLLAAGTDDGTQLWNVKKHRLVATLRGSMVSSVAFSPDGSLLAAGTDDGTQLWNVKKHRLVATLRGSMVSSVAFSPDGSLLADAAVSAIQTWKVATRKLLTRLPYVSEGGATSLAFSPDGSLLAIVAGAADIKLWSVSASKYLSTLPVSPYNVSFGLSKMIMLTADDSSVELWDPVTGQQLDKFVPPAGGEDAALSHNGMLLAIASGKAIQLWPVPYVGNTASYLCELAGESFPRTEWAQYAPGVPYMQTCP
jgi:WD40 repeat protein